MIQQEYGKNKADQCIIVLTTGRSGSSLVAGLIVKHGVWVAGCRPGNQFNPKGFFENAILKQKMINRFGRDWLGPFPDPHPQWPRQVMALIRSQGYEGGPWLYKCGASYWKVWEPLKPLFIKVWRNEKRILESYERCGFLRAFGPDGTRKIVQRQLAAMKDIPGLNVNVDDLVRGEREQIKSVIKEIGLEYNPQLVEEFIEPNYWHEAN